MREVVRAVKMRDIDVFRMCVMKHGHSYEQGTIISNWKIYYSRWSNEKSSEV